jgi:hypothetical protein
VFPTKPGQTFDLVNKAMRESTTTRNNVSKEKHREEFKIKSKKMGLAGSDQVRRDPESSNGRAVAGEIALI